MCVCQVYVPSEGLLVEGGRTSTSVHGGGKERDRLRGNTSSLPACPSQSDICEMLYQVSAPVGRPVQPPARFKHDQRFSAPELKSAQPRRTHVTPLSRRYGLSVLVFSCILSLMCFCTVLWSSDYWS